MSNKEAAKMDFKALQISNDEQGYRAGIVELPLTALGDAEVLVRVEYSSLNYKDALAVSGKGKIVRQFPLIPGIDFAGEVVESASAAFRPGDKVVLTGWGVGERFNGGLAQYARARADWLVPLPLGLDCRQAMAVGTAGLTAMLCVMALERHAIAPETGKVLVTGATGGVGSVAVAILARLGYSVVALSGKPDAEPWLRQLGAAEVLPREALSASARPLESETWAGAIDTVGSNVLAGLLPRIGYRGCVAACGLAGGFDLQTTVMPFILRGVTLAGVDSVMCPLPERQQAWQRIVSDLPLAQLQQLTREIGLDGVVEACRHMADGQARGRIVVRL
ncbi:MAG: MDR family oxidoreductase [Chitinivorax sp.]